MIPYFIHTNQDAEIIFWNPFLFNNKIEHFSYENIFNLLKIYFINKISENNRYFKNYLYVSGPKENGNIYIMLF